MALEGLCLFHPAEFWVEHEAQERAQGENGHTDAELLSERLSTVAAQADRVDALVELVFAYRATNVFQLSSS
jgi:hypothetical protein